MENKNKIPHWRNSSNIKYQNVTKKDNSYPNTEIQDRSLSWLGTGTSIKCGGVKIVSCRGYYFPSYLTDFSYFSVKKKDSESYRTQLEHVNNGSFEKEWVIFMDFKLFYFLTGIISVYAPTPK